MELQGKFSPTQQHRRQMIWQVWVPLFSSLVLVLALVVLFVLGAVQGSSQTERWGNLSAAWVIAPVLFVGLIFIVINFGCVYGMSKLLDRMPGWMLKVQLFMVKVSLSIRRAADASTLPVMEVNSFQARIQHLWKKFFS